MNNITIMLDFGGVLMRTRDTSPRSVWEERYGLSEWGLAKLVFDNPVAYQATVGDADTDDVWDYVRKSLDLSLEELANLKIDFWKGDRLNLQFIQYIKKMSNKYCCVILSNAWKDAREMFESIPELDIFEEIIISSEVGIAKPDVNVFLYACNKLKIKPQDVIFVDDMKENVNAAISLGMHGIIFESTAQTVRQVEGIIEKL